MKICFNLASMNRLFIFEEFLNLFICSLTNNINPIILVPVDNRLHLPLTRELNDLKYLIFRDLAFHPELHLIICLFNQ